MPRTGNKRRGRAAGQDWWAQDGRTELRIRATHADPLLVGRVRRHEVDVGGALPAAAGLCVGRLHADPHPARASARVSSARGRKGGERRGAHFGASRGSKQALDMRRRPMKSAARKREEGGWGRACESADRCAPAEGRAKVKQDGNGPSVSARREFGSLRARRARESAQQIAAPGCERRAKMMRRNARKEEGQQQPRDADVEAGRLERKAEHREHLEGRHALGRVASDCRRTREKRREESMGVFAGAVRERRGTRAP